MNQKCMLYIYLFQDFPSYFAPEQSFYLEFGRQKSGIEVNLARFYLKVFAPWFKSGTIESSSLELYKPNFNIISAWLWTHEVGS
jgi:hypothetical protein